MAEKIRRAERFSVRTRRAGADVPCVLQIRTVPSCGKDPAHREIFRQNKARGRRRTVCTSSPHSAVMRKRSGAPRDFPSEQGARAQTYRVYFKSAQCRHAEKIRARREIFRQNKACGRRCTGCTSNPHSAVMRKRSGAPRDFPPEQGVRAQTYRVYFKPAQRSYGGKDPARVRNSSRVNSKLIACMNAFALKCSGRPISRWRALRRMALSGLPLKPRV